VFQPSPLQFSHGKGSGINIRTNDTTRMRTIILRLREVVSGVCVESVIVFRGLEMKRSTGSGIANCERSIARFRAIATGAMSDWFCADGSNPAIVAQSKSIS
jgi:hypothetical protein